MLCLANSAKDQLDLMRLGEPQSAWPKEIKSVNDWFTRMFPVQAQVFGSPFLEQHQAELHKDTTVTPLVPNIDFLASCLGGDERLGHRVVYVPGELQFFFLDPRTQMYYATTSEKLGNLLRALLARCAAEVKGEGHLFNLFHTFRSDQLIKAVINRCKSVLEADCDFFGPKSPNQRKVGPELHQRLALVFASKILEPSPGSILTVAQTYALFNQFAAAKDMPAIKRTDFKSLMAEVIRDAYGLGVRNDLKNAETQKQQCGWLGLRPVDP